MADDGRILWTANTKKLFQEFFEKLTANPIRVRKHTLPLSMTRRMVNDNLVLITFLSTPSLNVYLKRWRTSSTWSHNITIMCGEFKSTFLLLGNNV